MTGSGPALALGPQGEVPHTVPLFQGSNFSYPHAAAADAAAAGQAFLYGRHGSPTVVALEQAITSLEGGGQSLAFASGMAATATAILACVRPGESDGEILVSEGIYGGSTELVRDLEQHLRLAPRFVPAWSTSAVAAAITPKTRVLLVESLTNPLLRIPDLPALGRLAQKNELGFIVDNTLTSPLLCRPLACGATVVVQSLSKFIAGHGDVIGGVATGSRTLAARLHRARTLLGGVLDPFAAWLALRGLRTLDVRLERQCATAAHLARALSRMRGVRKVHYPGLAGHPDRARCRRLFAAAGAMVSFELADGKAARRFYDRVRLLGRAASLGEVTSLLTHPASFSHKGLPPAERRRLGIPEGLLRLSVGVEAARDLEEDIRQALR